ncbi:MAG TPA: transposase, partial [Thermoguttaceae bacterium]|nr:transposase [Thermoguttaceae bacterium]
QRAREQGGRATVAAAGVAPDKKGTRRSAHFEERHPDWFTFEGLPSYAPELNPVEQCWNHTKYHDPANSIPDDLHHLQKAVKRSMTRQGHDQTILRSTFACTKLPLEPSH